MQEWLTSFHQLYRSLHIGLGFVGLGLFWVVVLARKGSALHRWSGLTFVLIGYAVGGTGLLSSIWGLVSPSTFLGRGVEKMAPAAQTALLADLKFVFSLLLVLSAGVVASLSFGWAVARCRDHYERLKNPMLVLLLSQTLALMLAGVLLGVWQLVSTSQSGRYWAVVIVGVLFAKDNLRNLRRINGAPPPSGTWALWHIHEMLGNGIAFYTAFAVFGFRRYVSLDLHGWWSILPWVLPGLVGAPLISLTKRRWTRRMGLGPGS